jgi:hypothetical protein
MKVIELDKQIVDYYSVVAIEEALQDLPSVVDVSFIEATAQVLVYCNDDSIDVAFLVAHLDGEVRSRTATVSCPNPRVELTDAAASQEHNATDRYFNALWELRVDREECNTRNLRRRRRNRKFSYGASGCFSSKCEVVVDCRCTCEPRLLR